MQSYNCGACDAGKYQDQDLVVPGSCQFCAAGKEFVAKDASCTDCVGGRYQSQNSVASPKCGICSNGMYSEYGLYGGATTCLNCPEGYTAAGEGASACGLSADDVDNKLAELNSSVQLTPEELEAASALREGLLNSFMVTATPANSSAPINLEKANGALNTVDSLVGEPSQVSPGAAAAASNFVGNMLGAMSTSITTPQEIPPEMLSKAGKIMDSLVTSMALSGAGTDGVPAVKMSANQAADVGMSLAKSAADLTAMGATEVGGKPISEFKANLLTSFLGVVSTAKPEPTLVNATVKTKDIKVQQQLSNELPLSAAGLDARYDAENPNDATIAPPKIEAIRVGLAKSLNVDVSQIMITQLSTVTTRRRSRRTNSKSGASSSSSSSSSSKVTTRSISRNLATTSLLINFEVLVTVEVDDDGKPKSEGFNAKELINLEKKLQLISEGQVTTADRTESGSSPVVVDENNPNRISIPDLGLVVEAVANVAGSDPSDIALEGSTYVRDTTSNATIGTRQIPCETTPDGCPKPDEGVTNAAIATVGAIVGNPSQNSAKATGAAASFLADALDDLSSPAGGTGVDADPVPTAVLSAAAGAIADTLTSAFSNGDGDADQDPAEAAKNMAALTKAASGLALASLRGIKPGAPPMKLKAGGLSLTAARANSSSFFNSADNNASNIPTSVTTFDDDLAGKFFHEEHIPKAKMNILQSSFVS